MMTLDHLGRPIPADQLKARADRLDTQAAVAWHDGNPHAATGLIRLARRLRLEAQHSPGAQA